MRNVFLLVLLFACALCAQETSPTAMPSLTASTHSDSSKAAAEETGPVVVPEMSEKARSYYNSGMCYGL